MVLTASVLIALSVALLSRFGFDALTRWLEILAGFNAKRYRQWFDELFIDLAPEQIKRAAYAINLSIIFFTLTILFLTGSLIFAAVAAFVVFNTASLPSLKDAMSKEWKALGYGVTEAREEEGKKFAALEGAERELRAIIKDAALKTPSAILPGTIKLNHNFTKATLIDGLRSGAPVVHIASHFSYDAAVPERSFLLLGESHLSVEEMQDLNNPFEKVELLTLSACDTAMGSANGKDVEGLAYVTQSLGAKSVIASLWPVSDVGTDELMVRFYKIRSDQAKLTKGEAFNLAQLSLLKGEEILNREDPSAKRTADDTARSAKVNDKTLNLPLYKVDPKRPFAHPHYWAAFILIGNWK